MIEYITSTAQSLTRTAQAATDFKGFWATVETAKWWTENVASLFGAFAGVLVGMGLQFWRDWSLKRIEKSKDELENLQILENAILSFNWLLASIMGNKIVQQVVYSEYFKGMESPWQMFQSMKLSDKVDELKTQMNILQSYSNRFHALPENQDKDNMKLKNSIKVNYLKYAAETNKKMNSTLDLVRASRMKARKILGLK